MFNCRILPGFVACWAGFHLADAVRSAQVSQGAVLDADDPANVSSSEPGQGGCAKFDVDNYKAPDSDACHLFMYVCSDKEHSMNVADRNAGDISWALTRDCQTYGKYLHVLKIDVARASVAPGLDARGRGQFEYKQCNWGVCGCPPPRDQCMEKQAQGLVTSNTLGWRSVKHIRRSRESCPCYQYSLPSRAASSERYVDNEQTAKFLEEGGYRHKDQEAPFQWKSKGTFRIVPIKDCFSKYIWREDATTEEMVAALEKHVLTRHAEREYPECDIKTNPPPEEEEADK
eukprot:TRINITY_DN101316_c0_g1_i1.p1 TRINITY_DN101316_c0_g1~~TRINITY_DN101316_c0_g1_i1.p1  ORF type:complete len:287 (+),score=63.86 TRINITY_DN101316_c0_g1_i1:87-947(+)